ncbi:MAG: tetratricopeptide repeat protein [Bacteroidales bacterium]|nr:tetratricopeptide repeat protein [Bacteroidales bacterium]MDY0284504.1 tetratricopeptide repeat protein [Bacteroidales bacterium]
MRIASLYLLIFVLAFLFQGCGNNNNKKTNRDMETSQPAAQDTSGIWLGKKIGGQTSGSSAQIKPVIDLSRIKKGIASAQRGEYQEAVQEFTLAIREDSLNPHFYYYRAEAYMNLQQYDKTWADIRKIERLDPEIKGFHALKGRYHNAVKQYYDAYHEFRIALQSEPGDALLWDSKGAACMNTMRLEEAGEAFDKALELDPNLASAYYNRGLWHANSNDFEKAVADISESIRLNPGNSQAFINLGNSYFMLKQYDNAAVNYRKALEINPDTWLAYNGLGSTYKAKNENKKAIQHYTRAIELNPEARDAVYNRGLAKYADKDLAGACTDWQKALSMGVTPAQKWLDMYCK